MSLSGVVYELALAHLLSGIYGNTFLRYSLSIGFFLLSSGLGSIYFSRLKARDLVLTLACIETILTLWILLSFPLALFFTGWSLEVAYLFIHVCIFVVGFLTGLELPILFGFESAEDYKYQSSILKYDFLGSGLAGIIFGTIFYPWFGLFQTVYFLALLNALVVLLLLYTRPHLKKWALGFLGLVLFTVVNVNQISTKAIEVYEQAGR